MNNIKKSLDKIFDVQPEEVEYEVEQTKPTVLGGPKEITKIDAGPVVAKPIVEKTDEEWEEDNDFETVRKNIQELTEKGKVAIDGALSVADATDKPSAFEAVATLIKTMADVNKDLYDLHKKRRDLKRNPDQPNAPINQTGVNINQAVFVGRTSDLLAQIEEEEKKEKL